ncbi:expressed unknown protein [Seminavis robusta]|uniref:Uncharacterized protein n=1 Tax=Seminavis robusta TaxID=568900 RepID=A0A9N8DE89_9STRA|nr:expressed unknown protein [Seminavis robusta]|eukprot:Sro48_g028250.1 n/a (181) ;mRNA; f:72727-73269
MSTELRTSTSTSSTSSTTTCSVRTSFMLKEPGDRRMSPRKSLFQLMGFRDQMQKQHSFTPRMSRLSTLSFGGMADFADLDLSKSQQQCENVVEHHDYDHGDYVVDSEEAFWCQRNDSRRSLGSTDSNSSGNLLTDFAQARVRTFANNMHAIADILVHPFVEGAEYDADSEMDGGSDYLTT